MDADVFVAWLWVILMGTYFVYAPFHGIKTRVEFVARLRVLLRSPAEFVFMVWMFGSALAWVLWLMTWGVWSSGRWGFSTAAAAVCYFGLHLYRWLFSPRRPPPR